MGEAGGLGDGEALLRLQESLADARASLDRLTRYIKRKRAEFDAVAKAEDDYRLLANQHRAQAEQARRLCRAREADCHQLETRCSRLSRELADAQVHIKVAIWTIAVVTALAGWGWIV